MVGFTENDTPYYYIKNLQGDVISIVDDTSTSIVTYHYDAWGNILSTETSTTESARIANLNPIRYRGYYYDTETELYYLNSRYYSAEMGRFINADDSEVLFEEQNSISEYNLFIYCLNNPVNMIDDTGYIAWWIGAAVGGAVVGGLSAGIKFGTFSSKSSLTNHFSKHKSEFGDMYENVSAYANDAKYVVKNGTYIPEKNAYIKFLGNNGRANYAFVGMKSGGRISIYHVEHVSKLIQKGITLFEI